MLPGQTRRRVDAIWDRIWASGVSNPLTAIEYFSTVLLLRRLRDRPGSPDSHNAVDGSTWLDLERYVADGDLDAVVSVMTRVQIQFGIGASPDVSTPETWRDLATLKEVLREVRNLDLTDRNHDILGDLFEYMLSHLSTAGHFGQFRTPRHLVRFLVEVVDPKPGETVVDPAAGTGGFLIAAHEHRHGTAADPYIGNEVDATMARVAKTNLLLHGMTGGNIELGDSLQHRGCDADVILANPPFAGAVVADRVIDFRSGTLKTELLFLELIMSRLRPAGRAGVVVPTGVLTSSASSAVWIRRQLLESNRLKAVVELPAGVFRPYTGVKTGLLIWSREPSTQEVLLIKVEHDGYTLDDKREAIEKDDLPAALHLLRGQDANVAHAVVSASDIAREGFNLSPTRYIASADADDFGLSDFSLHGAIHRTRASIGAAQAELTLMEGLLR